MPKQFTGMTPGLKAEVWVPVSMVDDVEPVGMNDVVVSPQGNTRLTRRGMRWMFVTARLNEGTTIARARSSVESTMDRLARDYPQTNRDRRGIVKPAASVRIHPMIDAALLPGAAAIMIAVGLVLLVACANIANLLLARGSSRRREMAIRVAVGAGRGRLVRQLLAESFVLATLGGLAGLLLAAWSVRLMAGIQPPFPIPISLDLSLDSRVLAYTAAIAVLTGLLFGLAPALQATKTDLVPSLKDDAAALNAGGRTPLRALLVVAQVTVSVVLLVGAALLTRGAMTAGRADVGFRPEGLAVATVDLAMHRYTPERGAAFYRDVLDRVRAIPGVTSAALVERLPFSPNIHTRNIQIDGRPYPPDARGDLIDVTSVGPGYFRTLGVPLLRGRDFDSRDAVGSPNVAIVNEAMARKYWPGANAVGQRIRPYGAQTPFEVIAVVRDYKVRTVGEGETPFVHFARAQSYQPSASVLARTTGDAGQLAAALRREMLALEPELVFIENAPMETAIATTLLPVRAGAALGAGFGLLALLLAAIGLYGVTAFWVSRRTREIGIRIALGATPIAVIARVLGQGMVLVGAGLVAGGALAAVATRSLAGMLYGISSIDPVSYGAAIAVLLLVAAAANIVPALRASRVDPVIALRST
jgi:predicted permease